MKKTKKILLIFTAALLSCMMLTSCDDSKNDNDISGLPDMLANGLEIATLTFDSSFNDEADSLMQELYMSDVAIFPDSIVEVMNTLTGLNFAVKISYENNALYVEWTGRSDLFADFAELTPREEFSFVSAEALRWFMLDSLWCTLIDNYGSVISSVYYVTNHAHDDITDPSPFNFGAPYRGSPFYGNKTPTVFSNELYFLDGDTEKDTLTVNMNNGDFAVFSVENLEVAIYGFEIVGNTIHVLDESYEVPVIVFTVTIIDSYNLQRNDTGGVFKYIEQQ